MDEGMAKDLLRRIAAEFGHKFTSAMPTRQSKEAAVHVWAERLAGLSREEVQAGIDKLPAYARRNDGWPPGASAFRELCRPQREPYERIEFQQRALTQEPLSAAENAKRAPSLWAALRGDYPGAAR